MTTKGQGRRQRSEHIWAWVLGGLEVGLVLSATLWFLTWPAVFQVYYTPLASNEYAPEAKRIVDWMSTNYRARSLNHALVAGRLSDEELRHYSDVRQVFRRFPQATLFFAAMLGVGLVWLRPNARFVGDVQHCALLIWLMIGGVIAGLGVWNWKLLFAGVHHPFFGDHSWRFPKGAYSLQLFPASFWRHLVGMTLIVPVFLLGSLKLMFLKCQSAAPGALAANRAIESRDNGSDSKQTLGPAF